MAIRSKLDDDAGEIFSYSVVKQPRLRSSSYAGHARFLRSPDEAQRNPGADSRTNPGLRHSRCKASAFLSTAAEGRLCHPGYRRASSPRVSSGPRACRSSCSLLPEGRAERQGVSPRPRRPHVLACGQPARRFRGTRAVAQPNAEDRWAEPGRRTQIFACVPHADGFCGLLHVPGVVTCADAPRSCELSPGHALGPSARVAGVCPCPFSRDRRSSLRPGSGIVAATRIPLPRIEDDRDAPLTGAGWRR